MPKQNSSPSPVTAKPPGIIDIPTASPGQPVTRTYRKRNDDTADLLRLVRQDIEHLSKKLSDYDRGYYAGFNTGHTAGVHWIVNRAEDMMMCHFKLKTHEDLVASDKYPSWWLAMLVDLIKKSPPKPEQPAQAVSSEGRGL